MGQTVSRIRSQASTRNHDSTLTTLSEASTSSSNSNSNNEGLTPHSDSTSRKRSRRSSLRRSVLGLLPHPNSSSSIRSNLSPSADTSQPTKKRWRSSRRWSKTPALPQAAELNEANSSRAGTAETMGISAEEHSTGFDRSGPTPEAVARREEVSPKVAGECSQSDEQPSNHDIGTAHNGSTSRWTQEQAIPDSNARSQIIAGTEHDIRQHLDPLTHAEPRARVPHDPQAEQTALRPEPVSQAPRQFPPPGTLVVVQGVVNTTDAPNPPRAPSSSRSRRPSSRSTTPRPASGIHRTPSLRRTVSASDSTSPAVEGDRNGTRSHSSSLISGLPSASDGHTAADLVSNRDSASPTDFSFGTSRETISRAATSVGSEEESRNEDDGRPRALSPGSIDVLGTLLSVAAAATAASLFSPGLAYPPSHATGNAPGANLPTSPTPAGSLAGLGNLPNLGLDPLDVNQAQVPGHAQRESRDRIRNVWESVRDRLGLNARTPGLSGFNPEGGGGGETRMRPGELMLAEMARALNIGLGLSNDGAPASGRVHDQTAARDENTTAEAADRNGPTEDSDRTLPPEDSFERFLFNLQADLRVALSDDGPGSHNDRNSAPAPVTSASTPQDNSEAVAGQSSPTIPSEGPIGGEHVSFAGEHGDDEPPPLEEVSDSDGDTDDESPNNNTHEADMRRPLSPRTPTPMPDGFPFGSDEHHHTGDGERRVPSVNLWRLYRFQPIPASQTQTHGHAATTSAQSASNSNADPTSASTPEAAASSTSTDSPFASTSIPLDAGSSSSATANTPATAADPNLNVVVPVIVVGLQSVDMARNHDNAHPHHDYFHPRDNIRTSESNLDPLDDWRPAGGSNFPDSLNAAQPRGRTWGSRAANALRTLRPGRRGGSHGARAGDSSGARTFLIYVIGGYYPPNHHMVTGSDSLDSYEALWELAELLGQVKPPVATREDIDNSGLQVIKSTDLQSYESEGKVASNCTDRCLICLDEYHAEDELRLMSCKHAFHKDCVDKWLQVGRNNCPACRSKGVSTSIEAAS